VVTVLITLALSALVLGALMATSQETRLSGNQSSKEKTFYLAERGVEESIAALASLGVPLVGAGPNGDQPVPLFQEQAAGEGKFSAWADPQDSENGSLSRYLAVSVRGVMDRNGMSKALRVQLAQNNFARYAYFSEIETQANGSPIWFTSADEFFGPVHTNDALHIYQDPVFHSEVSAVGEDISYYHGGPPWDNPVFEEGVNLGVAPITLPENTDLLRAKSQEPGGLYINGGTVAVEMLTMSGEGKLSVSVEGGGATLYDLPANGVFYVDGKVELQGELAGRMTLASSGDIEIMDDCVYHDDPREIPDSRDLLGLVSEGDVYMDGDPHGRNVDIGDETVMAVIMALDESWTVEDWNVGTPRGSLVVYGGIIQKRRGPVGSFNPWTHEIVTGYAKAYSYDPRLKDTPPPFFPTTGEIEKISWREQDPSIDIAENTW